MIGCTCAVCTSSDPHDQRTRPSVYVTLPDGTRILIDTSPDLRAQALRQNLTRVDAVLFTHGHADHVLGLDDMRRFNAIQDSRIPCYGDPQTIDEIRRTFSYVFDPKTPAGGGLPETRSPRRRCALRDWRLPHRPRAAVARKAALVRLPDRIAGLPHRRQQDPRRVVAPHRRRRRARARRAAPPSASHALQPVGSARRHLPHQARARLVHPHLPRPRSRGDQCQPAAACAAGI